MSPELKAIIDDWTDELADDEFGPCPSSLHLDASDVRLVLAALSTAEAGKLAAEARVAWRPIETAPRDGTEILAWCIHPNARWAGDSMEWRGSVVAHWIDHNGGGWTWHGLCGALKHWMPLPPPSTEASGSAPDA